MSIARTVPKVIGGSALAGIGLSLGRDIYKSSKKSSGYILLIAIFIAAMWLYVQSWTWIFRNYRSVLGQIFARVFSVFTLIIGLALTSVAVLFLAIGISDSFIDQESMAPLFLYSSAYWVSENLVLPCYNFVAGLADWEGVDQIMTPPNDLTFADKFVISSTLATLVLFSILGIYRGISQRRRRTLAWEAEEHNLKFMTDIGLREVSNNQFVDQDNNRYRFEKEYANMIELFPIGRRNRRAYIEFDEHGKFQSWSGIVKI
ncbi:hypothetical protein FM042_03870 [Aliidiomarina halalkaliphila]|uniref:Uncharacterized protein n=1 Tax=Aliidiomarina halalkaliphila TaxID=2593535 RepID=A0A552X4Q4_9GAMM|nr:hypothetical protein [Aliidiomarina halalkaliphila]TRW49998.1 hypothetical protein FM042_03870 [Aliidiomarina halalkaliphila]